MDCDGKDLIRPVRQLPNGHFIISRHRPDHTREIAIAYPVVAGKPMAAREEVATLKKLGDGSFEIVDSYVRRSRTVSGGPPQVSTEDYRTGWDRTFIARAGKAEAPS